MLDQARWLWRMRRFDVGLTADATRLFTMSIADLLEDFFESPQMLGVLSVSGVIGTWAGPRSPGTAYVMAHHHIGDSVGATGQWGSPRAAWARSSDAIAAAAKVAGAEIRTEAPVGAHRRHRRTACGASRCVPGRSSRHPS